MKRTLVLATAAALSACASNHDLAGSALYFGFARVDPVAEQATPDAWIAVRDGKIVRSGEGAPPRAAYAETRDMAGAFATPGLIDTHAHVTLGTVAFERAPKPAFRINYDAAYTEHAARMLLAYGVTTIRNPGGDAAINVAYREAAASGAVIGPEALVAGPAIDRTTFPFHGLADVVDAERSIEKIVDAQAAEGVDFVKLYVGLTEQDVAQGAAAAKAHGLPTIGHLSISWKKAAELGVDALVHAIPDSPDDLEPAKRQAFKASRRPGAFAFFEWWEAADLEGETMKEMIRTLAEKRVQVDLTLIAFKLAFWGDDPAVRDEHLSLSHPDMVQNWKTLFRFDIGWTENDYARAKAVWPKMLAFARKLHEAGVPMTLGTDQGNPFVAPGASLVQEMALHEAAGIERWAILRMATSDAARLLKRDTETGRIAAGLEADVVFTSADPTKDLRAFMTPTLVLSDGRAYDPAALRATPPRPAGKTPSLAPQDGRR